MTDELFELRDVTVTGIVRIRHLVINRGTTCVTGPSGSGKSTLLKILNAMVSPASGTVTYRGTDITRTDPVQLRREVVMLGQEPVVFSGTIADNVRAGCRWAGTEIPGDSAVKELMTGLGLEVDPSRSPATLSGGQKQRLCLARVIAMNPAVLLADEPSAALDDQSEELMFSCIDRWRAATGASVVAVTHASALAGLLGGTGIRLVSGRVAEGGLP